MERSIENIWTQGFAEEDKLLAPKLNNLYSKKSQLLFKKLKRTYRTDNKSIIPLAVLFALGLGVMGHVLLGIYVMVLMLGLYFLNNRSLASLENLRIEGSIYEFLVEYRTIVSHLQIFYTRLLGIGFPVAVLFGYYLYFRNSPRLQDLLRLDLLYIILAITAVAFILSALCIMAYRLSSKILYGNLLKKLDEMISDMTELRE